MFNEMKPFETIPYKSYSILLFKIDELYAYEIISPEGLKLNFWHTVDLVNYDHCVSKAKSKVDYHIENAL